MIINPIRTEEEGIRLAALAREIWNEHYVKIVGQELVDYMLSTVQSAEAIQSQIDSGYEYYWTLNDRHEPIGYMGLIPNEPEGKLMLSKLYVCAEARGLGVGAELLRFAQRRAKEQGAAALWLTVNRNNTRSIAWYHKKGFVIVDKMKQNIGSGFYMDDYVMECPCG